MKICVLIKQVPNEDAIIKISPDGNNIIEDNLTFSTNEPDTYALEEALLIKEKVEDCEVVVCTMGRQSSLQILKEGLAKGADRAIFIDNQPISDSDPLTKSKILSKILKEENFDLILSGLQSDDDGYAQTGLLLAELLNMTHASLVVGTDILDDGKIKVKKELESGWFQWTAMQLPSSLSIQSGLNKPRYASLKGIMGAKKKQIDMINLNDLDIEPGNSKTSVEKMYLPQKSKETHFIDGDTDAIVEGIIKVLKDEVKAI